MIVLPQRFDVHEIPQVESMIAELVTAGVVLVIDASEVRFMDRSAMDCLIEARLRCMDSGGDLALAAPSVAARVILELSGRYDALNPIEAAAHQESTSVIGAAA
jgi:anti-anti-sigma factor